MVLSQLRSALLDLVIPTFHLTGSSLHTVCPHKLFLASSGTSAFLILYYIPNSVDPEARMSTCDHSIIICQIMVRGSRQTKTDHGLYVPVPASRFWGVGTKAWGWEEEATSQPALG